ncbi:hypothetical protein Tco_1145965 [Tanacetum coccineum]
MLDKTQYNSWASRMLLDIKGNGNGKLLVDSVLNGPFDYGTVTEAGTATTPATVRKKRYDELTYAEKLLNHHEEAKHIWDRVKLLIEGSEISLHERESKLYDEFDMFTSVPGETIHSYYLSAYNEGTMIQQHSSPAPVANHSSVVHHQSYQPPNVHQLPQASFPLMDSGLVVLSFLSTDDPIACLNKAMAFISTAFTSRYPPTNNQLRTLSNPRNEATIQDGRVTEPTQQVRQRLFAATTVKRKATWQDSVPNLKILGIQHAFQTDDLDAFDSDCDEASSASVVLMTKLSSYDSEVLSVVPIHDNYLDNHLIDQNVQQMQYSEQTVFNNETYIDITSDSNMISYEQYLKETKYAVVQDTSSSAQQDAMIMFVIEEMSNHVAKCNEVDKVNKTVNESLTTELERYKEQIKLFEERKQFDLNDKEKYIDSQLRKVIIYNNAKVADFKNQIHSLKQQLNATVESHKTLSTTVDVLKMESKAKKDKYLDEIIDLGKKNKALDNVVYKMAIWFHTHFISWTHAQVRSCIVRYEGNTIVKIFDALFVIDTEEILELAKESRLKMHAKQNDPIVQEKKVNIAPIDFVALNKLSEHFVPQKQLSAEQAFCLVKDRFNKMRKYVNDFENVVNVRTKVTSQNKGSWGFEHIRKAFDKDVKPFVKTLKEYFHMFDQGLHKEITEMKEVFTQMETKSAKCSIERKTFEIKEKELLLENDPLLEFPISQNLVHTVVNSLAEILDYQSMEKSFLDEYSECVELKAELSKKNEMDNQPRNKPDALEFLAFFEINEMKAQLEAKKIPISILKDHIATLKGKVEHARALKPLDSDLDSASVISSTCASGSKPPSNTNKNRISRPTSSNKKNKVEDHLRSVKPSLNKKNRVSEHVCNANVKHSVLNANSELICATCNECMFDSIHDICVLDYVNDDNMCVKSKSVKSKKKKVWKPTGKVFTNVGYSWKPTGRTFTIDRKTCPLTRITSTIVVPPKKLLSTTVVKKTPPSSNTLGNLRFLTTRNPTKIGDPMFLLLHLLHVSILGGSNRPLVPGIRLLQAHDEAALLSHQLC